MNLEKAFEEVSDSKLSCRICEKVFNVEGHMSDLDDEDNDKTSDEEENEKEGMRKHLAIK